jgi:redox-sensitive bicupin YhaK (pirin superfamily)
MSAGSGIIHSESNNSSTESVEFLQIWILPKHRDITPIYDQKMFGRLEKTNTFKTIVSPDIDDDSLWINQDAYLSIGEFTVDKEYIYTIKKPNNGLYMFIIEGKVIVEDKVLHRRDGLGITEKSSIKLEISKDSTILLLDIPLN